MRLVRADKPRINVLVGVRAFVGRDGCEGWL